MNRAPTATREVEMILARFEKSEKLLSAAGALRQSGHVEVDLHTPFPIEGASEALGLAPSRVPLAVLIAALSGMGIGYSVQLFCNAIDFPINVGNRPPHAFLSFVPITFETSVLFGAFGALIALIWNCGFPMPWHPTQRSEAFRSATVDGLWLSLEIDPTRFDELSTTLRELGASEIEIVDSSAEATR